MKHLKHLSKPAKGHTGFPGMMRMGMGKLMMPFYMLNPGSWDDMLQHMDGYMGTKGGQSSAS